MSTRKPLIVEHYLEGNTHVRIRRGVQWAVVIRADEAIDLANALVDLTEQETSDV